MSHLIIQPFDVVYTPANSKFTGTWHNLQTVTEGTIAADGSNIPAVLCPVRTCGLKPDFSDAELCDIPAELAAEIGENPIKKQKMILADLRGRDLGVHILNVAGSGYKVHQNKTLFDSMVAAAKAVLGDSNFEIATVGTLGAYSQFFVSIAIKGDYEGFSVGEKDAWSTFFNLVSSHNGLVSSQTLLSLIRIVCMNTVQASLADGETSGLRAAIKHTVNSEQLITPQVFESNLRVWMLKKQSFAELCESLKAEPMTLQQFRHFCAGVFTSDDSDALSSVSYNRIEELSEAFIRGAGNTGETRYDAMNAWTQVFTSGNALGNPDSVTQAKRIASACFGRGNEWKLEAVRCLGEDFDATLRRGERYYEDKHKLMMQVS